ncbi:hypothetical protein [Humibacter sp.]|uniref:hypothetical protein n=1 Tax=Humibacter sp. TaxID=1940291 RepID=UPI003F7DDCCC
MSRMTPVEAARCDPARFARASMPMRTAMSTTQSASPTHPVRVSSVTGAMLGRRSFACASRYRRMPSAVIGRNLAIAPIAAPSASEMTSSPHSTAMSVPVSVATFVMLPSVTRPTMARIAGRRHMRPGSTARQVIWR